MQTPRDHIPDHKVGPILNSFLDKAYSAACESISSCELDSHLAEFSLIILNKIRIQYASAMHLTYNHRIDPIKKRATLDVASISSIIRSIYETYLLHSYIFLQNDFFRKKYGIGEDASDKSLMHFKFLLFNFDGGKQLKEADYHPRQEWHENVRLHAEHTRNQLQSDDVYLMLSPQDRKNIESKWRPKYEVLIGNSGIDTAWGLYEYKLLSWYCHNTSSTLETIDYYDKNPDKFNIDSLNCFLYALVSMYLIDIGTYLKIPFKIFSDDEKTVLGEFVSLAKNPPKMPVSDS